jgi:hypothetical protein
VSTYLVLTLDVRAGAAAAAAAAARDRMLSCGAFAVDISAPARNRRSARRLRVVPRATATRATRATPAARKDRCRRRCAGCRFPPAVARHGQRESRWHHEPCAGMLSSRAGMLFCAAGQVNRSYRAAAIGLLGPILLVALIVGIAGVASLVDRKRVRGTVLLGACVFLLACGFLLLQSWNRVMLRVNQTSQPAEAAR